MASDAFGSVLAYDASCGPCSRFKAVVDLIDPRGRVEFVTLEAAERQGLLDGIPPSSRYASFHLIWPSSGIAGREVRSGAEAVIPLMRFLSPRGALARVVEGTPGGVRAASFAYSVLSRLHRGCPVGGRSAR